MLDDLTQFALAFGILQEADKRLQVEDDWGIAVDLAMRQQLALLRLHLWSTGAIASMFEQLLEDLQGAVMRAAENTDEPGDASCQRGGWAHRAGVPASGDRSRSLSRQRRLHQGLS